MIDETVDELVYYQLFQKYFEKFLFTARNVKNIFTKTVWIQKRVFFKEPSFKLSKELAKMFRYIWSSRDGINGPQQSI